MLLLREQIVPETANSDIDLTLSVNHCWSLVNNRISPVNYAATFNYGNGADVDAGTTPSDFIAQGYTGGSWSTLTLSGTPTGTNTSVNGVTLTGDFAVGKSKANTTTNVNCATNPVIVFSETVCTATVTRASGTNTPSGVIFWGTDGTGAFTAANTCTLSPTLAAGIASCSVTYTPNAVGTSSHTISAAYGGNTNFKSSNGSQGITVDKATPTITWVHRQILPTMQL